jgi:hypothetical protein
LNKRLVLYGGVGLLLAFLVMGGEDKKAKPAPEKKAKVEAKKDDVVEDRSLASFLPGADQGSVGKTTEVFFRGGFREFREMNYLRAKQQFETVLQIDPNHRMAKIYLSKCIQEIDEEVKFHLEQGKKGQTAGKFKEAEGHYEAVLRLLHKDQANPSYVEAKDQLANVEKLLKGDEVRS